MSERAYRYLYVQASPALRRRIALAAALEDRQAPTYCRVLLERWLRKPVEERGELPEAPEEVGTFQQSRLPISQEGHRRIRVLAAERDVSISTLVVRVLHALVPLEVETLVTASTTPP